MSAPRTDRGFDPTRHLAWRPLRLGPAVLPWYTSKAVFVLGATAALAAVCLLALTAGSSSMTAGDALNALLHPGAPGPAAIVWRIRLPRIVTAALVGAALAASGGVFQSLSRNALGSPDVIGFTSGAAVGAVSLITLAGAGPVVVAGGALLGGLLAAGIVYGLSFVGGGAGGYRVVLVGIGVGTLCQAVTTLLLTWGDADIAVAGQAWLVGTVNARTWTHAAMVALGVLVFLPALLVLARHLATIELGDDLALQLGVPVQLARAATVLVGVGLVAGATAAVGPISFVALAAPHLTRRILRVPEVPVVTAALTGALLVVAADLLGRVLPAALQLPVGLTTGVLGGVYLLWLLTRPERSMTS